MKENPRLEPIAHHALYIFLHPIDDPNVARSRTSTSITFAGVLRQHVMPVGRIADPHWYCYGQGKTVMVDRGTASRVFITHGGRIQACVPWQRARLQRQWLTQLHPAPASLRSSMHAQGRLWRLKWRQRREKAKPLAY